MGSFFIVVVLNVCLLSFAQLALPLMMLSLW